MLTDPFSLKSRSKFSPTRIAFTARARANDYVSRRNFASYDLPEKILPGLPPLPADISWADTAVTELQMQHVLKAIADTEALGGCVVEIGSYRGVTLCCIAAHTGRKVVSVDPFLGGYGATNTDYDTFQKSIAGKANIVHVRKTSGAGAVDWQHGPASFIFLDAVHDYANTTFDISVWWPLLVPGGIMAFHDTDDRTFAGTRRGVFELAQRGATLYAHPNNMTLLRKPA